jgi:hypothetical protein
VPPLIVLPLRPAFLYRRRLFPSANKSGQIGLLYVTVFKHWSDVDLKMHATMLLHAQVRQGG